jgi:DNA-binding NarL/FixJ family response regulator
LLGAAYTLRDTVGYSFNCPERPRYERTESALRNQLGSDAFDRARQAGSTAALQDSLDEATRFINGLLNPTEASSDRRGNRFGLTSRESDVLRLLAEGQTDKQIADALFIGVRTAESHVSSVLSKLGARNRAEAAAYAVREGVV